MAEKILTDTIKNLCEIVKNLETVYKEDERKFTVDGHLLGSIGEVFAKEKYNLTLLKNSNPIHDAEDKQGNKYQIKITQRTRVAINSKPDNLIVIQITNNAVFSVIFKGEGKIVWDEIKHLQGKQKYISLTKLRKLKKGSP